MEISGEKVQDILNETKEWCNKDYCTRKEVESLARKLHFVGRVVRPIRVFVSAYPE